MKEKMRERIKNQNDEKEKEESERKIEPGLLSDFHQDNVFIISHVLRAG